MVFLLQIERYHACYGFSFLCTLNVALKFMLEYKLAYWFSTYAMTSPTLCRCRLYVSAQYLKVIGPQLPFLLCVFTLVSSTTQWHVTYKLWWKLKGCNLYCQHKATIWPLYFFGIYIVGPQIQITNINSSSTRHSMFLVHFFMSFYYYYYF